jgi:NAD(P)-dependent dehydrogenase (short-subunit alcohol dehydrogenase family)
MKPAISELISLKGRGALITGAGAGIGAAMARRFAEAGAALRLLDVDAGRLDKIRGELEGDGASVSTHEVDLSRKEEIDGFWHGLEGEAPGILVNNAGSYPFQDFLGTDEALVQRSLGVNQLAVLWMCQHFIERRLKQGGTIVNVASIEALLPFKAGLAHYSMAKAGVIGLTRALAREYGSKGFRANVILPGGIMTEGTRQSAKGILKLDLGLVKDGVKFMSRLSLGRMGQPDDVARVCLMLASDVSSYMTGAVVPVDGGFLSS